jgi:hypothetical protein
MPTGEKGKSYKENMEYHHGTSWKVKLRVAVGKSSYVLQLIRQSGLPSTMRNFYKKCS